MLTGRLLSKLRFVCVEGRGEKKREKPAKTKAEFLLQLFETINEPQCDVVGVCFTFPPSFPHPVFIISQSWQWEGAFSKSWCLALVTP